MNNKRGFTVIELLIVAVILAVAGFLVFTQKQDLQTAHDDEKRKIAINTMHYSLEEAFYKANGYYPTKIEESVLMTVDPELFTDPSGTKLGETGSDYRYEATGCIDGKCRGYRLSATLENEADFVKTNRSNED